MTDDTIFDHIDTQPSNEDIQSYKDLLVGEGKKFKSDEDLARGKFESDRFIEQLQREQAQLRQELNSRLNMEDLVKKIGSNTSTNVTPTSLESNQTPTPVVMPTKAEVDPNEIASIVKNTMTQEQTKQAQTNNLNSVAAALKNAWGDNWVSKLRSVGSSLDMTEAQMDTLAKTAPKVLLASVLKETTKVDNDKFAAPRSSIMGIPAPVKNSGWEAYEKMRKENPREYFSQRVQMQLHKDVLSGKVVPPSNE